MNKLLKIGVGVATIAGLAVLALKVKEKLQNEDKDEKFNLCALCDCNGLCGCDAESCNAEYCNARDNFRGFGQQGVPSNEGFEGFTKGECDQTRLLSPAEKTRLALIEIEEHGKTIVECALENVESSANDMVAMRVLADADKHLRVLEKDLSHIISLQKKETAEFIAALRKSVADMKASVKSGTFLEDFGSAFKCEEVFEEAEDAAYEEVIEKVDESYEDYGSDEAFEGCGEATDIEEDSEETTVEGLLLSVESEKTEKEDNSKLIFEA